jgi:hypothetical protein
LDSGCNNHMIGNKEWLFDYDDTYKYSVKLGDDSKMNNWRERKFEAPHWRLHSSPHKCILPARFEEQFAEYRSITTKEPCCDFQKWYVHARCHMKRNVLLCQLTCP